MVKVALWWLDQAERFARQGLVQAKALDDVRLAQKVLRRATKGRPLSVEIG